MLWFFKESNLHIKSQNKIVYKTNYDSKLLWYPFKTYALDHFILLENILAQVQTQESIIY